MTPAIHTESARIVRDYLRAKDAQVPHLFSSVFTEDALFISAYEQAAPFGDSGPKEGLTAITELFRYMGERCENIITVVPTDTLNETVGGLACDWVVAMTQRNEDGGFVGWGRYEWEFGAQGTLAKKLLVRFQGAVPMDSGEAPAVLDVMSQLAHPWCALSDLRRGMRGLSEMQPLEHWLEQLGTPSRSFSAGGKLAEHREMAP